MLSPTEIEAARRIPPLDYRPPDTPLDIVHMDEHLIVLNKPTGLLSVPGRGDDVQDSLELRVRAEYPNALLIHRLDMDTSGIMIMARNKDTQRNLGLQFEQRKTQKTYTARVWGHIQNETDRIDLPLRCDWDRRPLQMVCYEHGKPAQTDYKVIGRDIDENGAKTTRVELSPITGRSHQLRVHMAQIGHPIVGDCFYAPEEAFSFAPRLLLHAQELTVHHPVGGALTTFRSEITF